MADFHSNPSIESKTCRSFGYAFSSALCLFRQFQLQVILEIQTIGVKIITLPRKRRKRYNFWKLNILWPRRSFSFNFMHKYKKSQFIWLHFRNSNVLLNILSIKVFLVSVVCAVYFRLTGLKDWLNLKKVL